MEERNMQNLSDTKLTAIIEESEANLRALRAEAAARRAYSQAELAESIKGLSADERLDACLTPINPSDAEKMMSYGIKAAAEKKVVAWYTRRSLSGPNLTDGRLYAKSANGTIYKYGRHSGVLGDLFKVGKGSLA
jgi:hypothetical protein